MRVISHRCICPVCREHFTAFMADVESFHRDEIDPSQRCLLCVMCERRFITNLFVAMHEEIHGDGQFSAVCLRVSALLQEAPRAGEPGPSAQVGTDNARRVSAGMQGMLDGNGDTEVSHGVSGHVDTAHEALRRPSLLPPDPVGEEGVM